MLELFEEHIKKNKLFSNKHRLLLAVSGGLDSVVLAWLLKKGGYSFTMAHCNFNLRGQDSLEDEHFCIQLAGELGVEIRTTRLDVGEYRAKHPVSVQMAARELRYAWFTELLEKEKFDYLLTAHHAGDQAETFFINLMRGTGIKGLKGMSVKKGRLVRPLLPFTKQALDEFASRNSFQHRTDKSNLEDKYARNYIRLNIIPQFKKIDPGFEEHLQRNMDHLKEEAEIVTDYLAAKARLFVNVFDESIILSKSIAREKHAMSLLNFILGPLGFNSTQQNGILKNIQSGEISGAVFNAPGHRLTIDREQIVVKPADENVFEELLIKSLDELVSIDFLEVLPVNKFAIPSKNELYIDPEKVVYPLSIRNRKTGDRLKPFGMNNFKLLSDLLKEEKLNAFEKEKCRLLVNGNGEIIWVMGYRSDERYRVDPASSDLLKLSIIGK
jgi:tRNA(Ile)-lysidine synthase